MRLTWVSSGCLIHPLKLMESHHQPNVGGFLCGMKSPVVPASSVLLFGVVSILINSLTFSPLCSRRDSAWRRSSPFVLNTQNPTVACPLAPPWLTCRKSIRSLKSYSSLMKSLCLRKPWWALMSDTGATRKALSMMRTGQSLGASVRAVAASFPPGVSEMRSCSGTSPGLPHRPPLPFWKLLTNPLT